LLVVGFSTIIKKQGIKKGGCKPFSFFYAPSCYAWWDKKAGVEISATNN
jgi:hypothetical protein